MTNKTFNLPAAGDMLERLLKVDDNSHLRQKFYPLLIKQSGEQREAAGVVIMLELALYDYGKGMPPLVTAVLSMQMERFIDAPWKTLWGRSKSSSFHFLSERLDSTLKIGQLFTHFAE